MNDVSTVAQHATWKELFSGRNGLKAIALAAGVILHATDVFLATTIMPSVRHNDISFMVKRNADNGTPKPAFTSLMVDSLLRLTG